MFSPGWKTTFLEKKKVYELTYLESRTEVRCQPRSQGLSSLPPLVVQGGQRRETLGTTCVRCKQKYRVIIAIYAN